MSIIAFILMCCKMRNPQVEDMIVVVDMMTIVEEEEVVGTMTVAVSVDLECGGG